MKNLKIGIFLFLLLPTIVYPITVDQLLHQLQKRYASLEDLKANFYQSTIFQTLGALNRHEVKARGIFYLKRPNMMRWEYERPQKQLIISDGKKIWVYLKEDRQVMVGDAKSVLDKRLLSSFFMNTKEIKEEFDITIKRKDGQIRLTLIPKVAQPNLKSLDIWLKEDNYQIIKVYTVDLYGNATTIVFIKISYNLGLPNSLFHFTPPKGIEIIKMP